MANPAVPSTAGTRWPGSNTVTHHAHDSAEGAPRWRRRHASAFHAPAVINGTLNLCCRLFFTEEMDGLQQAWSGTVYCNPPYETLPDWTDKMLAELKSGRLTKLVALVPARPETNIVENRSFARSRLYESQKHLGLTQVSSAKSLRRRIIGW